MTNKPVIPEDLLHEDGENNAVRMFLAAYGCGSPSIKEMKNHLEYCGYPFWPEWAEKYEDTTHLTKGGAQSWIRHLFSLEPEAVRARACVELCAISAGMEMKPGEVTDYSSFIIIFRDDGKAELKPTTEDALLELREAVTKKGADFVMLQVALAKLKTASTATRELLNALKDEHARSFTRIGNSSFCRWNNANDCKVCSLIAKAGVK